MIYLIFIYLVLLCFIYYLFYYLYILLYYLYIIIYYIIIYILFVIYLIIIYLILNLFISAFCFMIISSPSCYLPSPHEQYLLILPHQNIRILCLRVSFYNDNHTSVSFLKFIFPWKLPC